MRKSQINIRIIRKSNCQKLSPASIGELTYHIGYDDQAELLYLRVTENTGGGFFSNQWISLQDIESVIEDQEGEIFKAVVFAHLYESTGSNNAGFLGAVLRKEGILVSVDAQPLCHVGGDIKKFCTAMEKLINRDIDLHDEVAEEEAKKEARRKELLAKLNQAKKAKASAG